MSKKNDLPTLPACVIHQMPELDLIIESVLEKYKDNQHMPIDILTFSVISSSEEYRTLRSEEIQHQCFTYILQNLQTIISGEIEEKDSKDIKYQAEDFAASHLRAALARKDQKYEDHVREILQTCDDFHEKLQYQTDLTYSLATVVY